MAATEEEFAELLGEESESAVDLQTLREVSRFGIPDKLRGEVWKYLLGVAKPDKCK
jgi:hypothetical protein